MSLFKLTIVGSIALAGTVGCSGTAGGEGTDEAHQGPESWTESSSTAAKSAPTFEQFASSARTVLDGKEFFLVEEDMLFPDEASLRDYYDSIYVNPVEKSIVNFVNGANDTRPTPTNIKYCFAAGWGQQNCVGGTCYTAPPLEPMRTNLRQAMDAWQGVANVNFVYMSNLDGAGCSNTGANPGVSFVVQHYSNASTAQGAFPSNPWANQWLHVPTSGLSRLLAIHELGHVLGFRHEHIAPDATPRCIEDSNFIQLTPFDTLSCMKYANCNAGSAINGTEISMRDGIGARMLYKAPNWWWGRPVGLF